MEGMTLRLASPTQSLPWQHGRDKGRLKFWAQSRQDAHILWEPRSVRPMGRKDTGLPLAMVMVEG